MRQELRERTAGTDVRRMVLERDRTGILRCGSGQQRRGLSIEMERY